MDLQRTRLMVVAERTRFPPLPIISAFRSTLHLRLHACNRHFPDSCQLASCSVVIVWHPGGRLEDNRKDAAFPFPWWGGASDGGSSRSRRWRVTRRDSSSRVGHSAWAVSTSQQWRNFQELCDKCELLPGVTAVFSSLANASFSLWHLWPANVFVINPLHGSP